MVWISGSLRKPPLIDTDSLKMAEAGSREVYYEALYTTPAVADTNTPAFNAKERLRLIYQHENGECISIL